MLAQARRWDVSDRRWALSATSPSTGWLREISPDLIEQQHIKTKKPPIVSIIFTDGIWREAVQQVADHAVAEGAYDITVSSIPWPHSQVDGG